MCYGGPSAPVESFTGAELAANFVIAKNAADVVVQGDDSVLVNVSAASIGSIGDPGYFRLPLMPAGHFSGSVTWEMEVDMEIPAGDQDFHLCKSDALSAQTPTTVAMQVSKTARHPFASA